MATSFETCSVQLLQQDVISNRVNILVLHISVCCVTDGVCHQRLELWVLCRCGRNDGESIKDDALQLGDICLDKAPA
jgi:hypothetical protein